MPAAAVIPAPIAYIKVAAVKKLVVGSQSRSDGPFFMVVLSESDIWPPFPVCSSLSVLGEWHVYFEKIRVLKAGNCLNLRAWNDGIGPWFYFVGFRNSR